MEYSTLRALTAEHRVIEQVLDALERFGSPTQPPHDPRPQLAKFVRFLRDYADGLHHRKEEDRLFVVMNAHGFSSDAGPVGVMLADHAALRAHVRCLDELASKTSAFSEADWHQMGVTVRRYCEQLRDHILKEDDCLYPMAEQAVPVTAMQALDGECAALDEASRADAEGLRQLVIELTQA